MASRMQQCRRHSVPQQACCCKVRHRSLGWGRRLPIVAAAQERSGTSHISTNNVDSSPTQPEISPSLKPQPTPSPPNPSAPSTSAPSWLNQFRETAKRQSAELGKWGLAGVVAYGACNTIYYSAAFILCWCYVANVPKGQGLAVTVKAFAQVFATVWAGSQVTKLARAGLALFLAPFTDRILDMVVKLGPVKTKKEAFLWFLAICLTIAATIFAAIILAWR